MKKLLIIFLCLFLLMFPKCLKAEIKNLNLEEALKSEGIEPSFDKLVDSEKQINVSFFRTKGEEKSVALLKFLNDHYEEYGVFFKLSSYEVSENQDNYELMENVFDYLGAQVDGTPFIVIGDAYITTYNESVNNNIVGTIMAYYDAQDKTDKVDEVLTRYYRNENLIIFFTIIIISSIIGFVVYASKKNK